ncbi:beta-N-acetylhexosaminidase [Vibrio sp. 404]|uniref:beta-N-acetylhexosaminidase n=1 Tax=Vibrio marinisediminis TaxID=2758441 RepID=A0A7W2FQA5_9VIBR|nr:family 20 glycosylhydrolase [Vibrio marinisediminis]MBA5762199.1 beta-N-acetylhexosaminidase [Vibrio marinisediminis]
MSYRIDLTVLSEQKQFCRFGATLHNLSDQDLINWKLQFIIDRYILPDSFTNGDIEQIGSFCTVTPEVSTLKANQHYYCEFSINTAPLRYYTDGFKDALVLECDGEIKHPVVVTPIALASPYRERSELPEVEACQLALVPKPNKVDLQEGHYLLSPNSQITLQSIRAEKAATWLQVELESLYDFKTNPIGHSDMLFRDNPTLDEGEYILTVSGNGIRLEAGSAAGFVHASATLLQLVEVTEQSNTLKVPCIRIADRPRFRYRGMMLDCARHFHSVERVKRLINHLAHYKFNHFHWHLTDDEGWRIEIKAFPELTEIGARRGVDMELVPQFSTLNDVHEGYYSQDEIRQVISFAAERGITVIPEIDIPGHCRAALKALPHLLQDTQDQSQYRSIQHYNDNVLSPALEGTYQFLDTVLTEVAELFPSPWIHIGADEVPDGVWVNSPSCKVLMAQHGYHSSKDLQGHLLRHAEKHLQALGKRMVGWEEAQHGNKVSKDTVIYSWLSEEAALNCASQGFDVILQPAQYTYLDMTQDYSPDEPGVDWASTIPLESAYHYEPLKAIPDSDPIRKRILGIQCALWCEIITHQKRMDYMVFPRLTAMAEACWTDKSQRDWTDYLSRLKGHLPLLDRQSIKYRQPWKNK